MIYIVYYFDKFCLEDGVEKHHDIRCETEKKM